MNEIVLAALIITGTGFIFLASLGILRMPDLYMRMSTTTKAATIGIAFMLFSTAMFFQDFAITTRVFATVLFVLLTVPTAAHMIGRAGYFNKVPLWENSVIDELHGRYNPETHKIENNESKSES